LILFNLTGLLSRYYLLFRYISRIDLLGMSAAGSQIVSRITNSTIRCIFAGRIRWLLTKKPGLFASWTRQRSGYRVKSRDYRIAAGCIVRYESAFSKHIGTAMSEPIRLDQLLITRSLFESRSRGRDAIQRGTVKVDGVTITKAGMLVSPEAEIAVDDPAQAYVSRAALKLIEALDHFKFSPEGLDCLDIGASTGGFTQVLLERGVNHVIAVDVGHDQMDPKLREDRRITNLEGVNARTLDVEQLEGRTIMAVVSDVSFISLKLAVLPALEHAASGAWCVLLVKPQFEAGRDNVGKGGMLKDPSSAPKIAEDLKQWLMSLDGWQSLGVIPSPIAGGDGNVEFLLAGKKS
jgi:23S rRNA (cytidine1920-2'-O)/16S rRNA (cytidine1409-2'-O)-methyltransferase